MLPAGCFADLNRQTNEVSLMFQSIKAMYVKPPFSCHIVTSLGEISVFDLGSSNQEIKVLSSSVHYSFPQLKELHIKYLSSSPQEIVKQLFCVSLAFSSSLVSKKKKHF